MITIDLSKEKWEMTDLESSRRLPATAPGSVLSVLLDNEEIEDPYDGENERKLLSLFDRDYEFSCNFNLRGEFLQEDEQELVCYGLDTIAEITLNGERVGRCRNMHRTYRFAVKDKLHMGDNELTVKFFSPLRYIREYKAGEGREVRYTPDGALFGSHLLRKAHSSFGWDWGPQLPDMGIFRTIRLEAYDKVHIREVYFFQEHIDGGVTLFVDPIMEYSDPIPVEVMVSVSDEAPVTVMTRMPDPGTVCTVKGENEIGVTIHDPKLWWPNGMGDQPLYEVKVVLKKADKIYDERSFRIGLRTVQLSREKDEYGEEFCFVVNGRRIFAKGADYIPEEAIYPRITEEKQRRLIADAKAAHFNFLRVWGGGYYPSDAFYDMCDEAGILIWQDLMFACNIYELTPSFEKSILAETRDNVARLRHHACLALWCGNNEIESGWDHWPGFADHSPRLRADYIKIFEYLLPKAVREADETTEWWPSSPSSGGSFDAPDDENRGDAHYWEVWHGKKPFTEYRKHHFRFLSEFGFQSFPGLKTVRSFTRPEDRNIFSPVMESHQKNEQANGTIMYYIAENFRYPKDFAQLLYVSQVQQALAMQTAVEHFRRDSGRCAGTLFWQLNDNWPVASWSAVDYYGRWKALMYAARRFYAPHLCSLLVEDQTVTAYVTNDSFEQLPIKLQMTLATLDGREVQHLTEEGRIPAGGVWKGQSRDFSRRLGGDDVRQYYVFVEYELGRESGITDAVFVPYKHLDLKKPDIDLKVSESEEAYEIVLTSNVFTPFVMLELKDADVVFSDNCFSLHKGKPRLIRALKADIRGNAEFSDAESFREQLEVYHLYGSY
ncbi:MAG: glycoside hydrolase family 2 protein [Lachnospiraceae bacterium]|nr:glycoside hydrolase family 2 protein [Lachnospiraceae bacterium]